MLYTNVRWNGHAYFLEHFCNLFNMIRIQKLMYRYLPQTSSQSNDYHRDYYTDCCQEMPQLKREDAQELQTDQQTHKHDGDPLCFGEAPEIGTVYVSTHELKRKAPHV